MRRETGGKNGVRAGRRRRRTTTAAKLLSGKASV